MRRRPATASATAALTTEQVAEVHAIAAALLLNPLGSDGTPTATPEQSARLRAIAGTADVRDFTDEALWWNLVPERWGVAGSPWPSQRTFPGYVLDAVLSVRAREARIRAEGPFWR